MEFYSSWALQPIHHLSFLALLTLASIVLVAPRTVRGVLNLLSLSFARHHQMKALLLLRVIL